jgi:transposase
MARVSTAPITTLEEALAVIARLTEQVAQQELLIRQMQDQLRRLLHGRFGARTERMLGAQAGQQLIDSVSDLLSREQREAAMLTADQPAPIPLPAKVAAAEAEQVPPVAAKRAPRRPSESWSQRHPELPVETVVLEPSAEDLVDSAGQAKVAIGEEVSERLGFVSAKLVIKRSVRKRYASPTTLDERTIAPQPPSITPSGSLDDSLVHWLMAQRFGYSFPFFRSLELLRCLGVVLPRSTVNDAAADWAAVMWPLAQEIRKELLRQPLLFADHAVMRQQDPERDGSCRRIPIFVLTDGQRAFFDAPPTLNDARAEELLHGFTGQLIGDDWSGWHPFDPGGCNAHARRPFAELQAISPEARDLIERYAKLYAIEADIRQRAAADRLDGQALWDFRRAERHRLGGPAIMDGLRRAAEAIAQRHPKGTTLGNGARYILRLWPRLIRFLDDGTLLPDNNTAERALRPIALNRKNSLFLGQGDASPDRAAIAWTIFTSCRLQGIDPIAYLAAVTPTLLAWRIALLEGTPRPDLSSWTPIEWTRQMAATKAA